MISAMARRICFRLYRLLWVDSQPTEISGSMAAFLWGLFMVVNSAEVVSRGVYGRVLEVMSADAWGWFAMAMGAIQGLGLLLDCYPVRRLMAVAMMCVWSVLFFLLLSTMHWRAEIWFYLIFALGGLWSYVQLPIHRGR